MNSISQSTEAGQVASLHLHPEQSGGDLREVREIEVFQDKGIVDNGRHFGRVSRSTGRTSRRQVSLIEREQIAEHAAILRLQNLQPGIVRSNIETLGINLISLIGHTVQIGEAVLFFYAPRTPCSKMDDICMGLRELMEKSQQGVLAEVIKSGRIRVGDFIKAMDAKPLHLSD